MFEIASFKKLRGGKNVVERLSNEKKNTWGKSYLKNFYSNFFWAIKGSSDHFDKAMLDLQKLKKNLRKYGYEIDEEELMNSLKERFL